MILVIPTTISSSDSAIYQSKKSDRKYFFCSANGKYLSLFIQVISSTIWGCQPSNAVVLYCNGRTKKCSIGTKLQHWVQWQLSTPSTPLPISHQSSTTGDTSSRVAEKNQGEYIHFQCLLIIDQCNANWSKSVSSNTQQLNCHLDPNPIPMHCKTNTCRYQSNANQEPLFYHLDMSNQCRWLGYQ